MTPEEINLYGKICPYPVVEIFKEVAEMKAGETKTFCVDDPLAIKSVPDELAEYNDIKIDIKRQNKGWNIIIRKE